MAPAKKVIIYLYITKEYLTINNLIILVWKQHWSVPVIKIKNNKSYEL